MTASSSVSEQKFQQTRVKSRGLKLSRAARFWFVLAMFTVSSIFAFTQPLSPDPYKAAAFPSLGWLTFPREQNAHRRLPEIKCDLNAVYALSGTDKIWAVGNRGLIAHSDDGGRSWRKQTFTTGNTGNAPATTPSATPIISPTPASRRAVMRSQSFLKLPNLLPVAHAAEQEASPQQSNYPSDSKAPDTRQSDSKPAMNQSARPNYDEAKKESIRQREERMKSAGAPLDYVEGNSNPTRGVNPNRNSSVAGVSSTPRPANVNRAPSAATNRNAAPVNSPLTTPTPQASAYPQTSATPDAPSIDEDLIAVYFADSQRGWILGRSGTLLSTVNGGGDWSWQQNGAGAALRSAQFVDSGPLPNGGRLNWLVDQSGTLSKITPSSGDPRAAAKTDLGNVAGVHFVANGSTGWAVGSGGTIFNTTDEGYNWNRQVSGTTQDLHAVQFLSNDVGWAVGKAGTILRTDDGGRTWATQLSGTTSDLNAVTFLLDGQNGWAAGNDGTILSTSDGGENWFHQTQESTINKATVASSGNPLRSLPPWYYFSLLGLALALWPIRKPPPPSAPPEESIADVLIADRPLEFGDPDPLNFTTIALGLSRFLRNDKTVPPLTIAVIGEWGTGKSSLMNLLRTDLMRFGFRPVWFNAWHHQKEEHLLASMLQNIKLQAIPPWWRPNGLRFRAKLLWIRGWRHRLPVLLLLLLLSFFVGHEIHHTENEGVINKVADAITRLDIKALPSTLVADSSLLALLVNIVGVVIAAWKGMTAFKVNPASLMASMSRSVRIRDLAAQTGFRQKFATEFKDVTTALGSRSMLLFIDDLDRCHPENVLEVLEAVNFLVASGDCFVVMGMARDRVERCVGLSFKDVAEEMANDPSAAEGQSASSERAKQRRGEFARQYLDKLINIEVPVPVPTGDQFGRMMVPDSPPPKADDRRVREIVRAGTDAARRYWPAAMVLLILALGYAIGAGISFAPTDPANSAKDSSTVIVETREETAGGSSVTTPNMVAGKSETNTGGDARATKLPPTSNTAERKQIPEIVPPATASTPLFHRLVVLVTFLAAIALGGWAFTRRSDVVTKDSKEFEDALRIWCPLVYARQKTPRSIKRFMNRVRYLAMRYRPQDEPATTPWQDFFLRVGYRFGAKPKTNPAKRERERIEPILVALASIHHLNPAWIENENQWTAIANDSLSVVGGSVADARTLVQQTRDAHIEHFGRWGVTNQHREDFLKMLAGIRVN